MGDSGPSDSQAGDDPAFEGDEGVGYGNVNTTTQQFQDDQSLLLPVVEYKNHQSGLNQS